jgi:conjugal transfer pilus assembly protein TraW
VWLLLFSREVSWCQDYGIIGHTHEILEQDLVELLQQKFYQWKNLQWKQEKIIAKMLQPAPVEGLYTAIQTRSRHWNPIWVLPQDQMDAKGVLLATAGMTINPFHRGVQWHRDLVFVDGTSEQQVKWALAHWRKQQGRLKIILIRGAPIELAERWGVIFYFDQGGFLSKKLQLQQIPALVSRDGDQLLIQEVVVD